MAFEMVHSAKGKSHNKISEPAQKTKDKMSRAGSVMKEEAS